jgi:hypothetical protein
MKKLIYVFAFTGLLVSCNAPDAAESKAIETATSETTEAEAPTIDYQAIDTDEALVATALMAAPEASRGNCTVIGFNMAGEFVTFKEGTNEFICITDDPKKEGFNAACYHKSLEPFMARGRALRAEGKKAKEIFDIREEEAKAGTLTMGDHGSTLHIYNSKNAMYDPATGEVDGAKYRYVVYLPFATAASTGLPETPISQNHPWIMNPGTHRAHIMITPVK